MMFLVFYIQIFPYIFLAHRSVTATIAEHGEVKIRTKAASNKCCIVLLTEHAYIH